MAFGLAFSFYRNILFDQTLNEFAFQNTKLREAIRKSRDDLDYYQSRQFKDKYAKETLGRVSPGERVLVLSQDPSVAPLALDSSSDDADVRQAVYDELLDQMPVIEHWNLFLFKKEKIEELRSGL